MNGLYSSDCFDTYIDLNYFSMCTNGTFRCNKLDNCVPKCSTKEYTCNTTGDCIPLQWVCDKTNDCNDGSDEVNCSMYIFIPI